jgi:polar amino acid transport system permease protein
MIEHLFGRGTFGYEVWIARGVLLNGLYITLSTSVLIIIFGTIIGLLFGLSLVYAPRPLRWVLRVYVDVIRGTPVLVLLFFWFYGSSLIGLDLSPFVAGVCALAAFCTAHTAEVTRGAFGSIPQAQSDAAKAIGLGFWGRLVYALGPQALRRMLPPWTNTAVEMIKGSTLLSLIGVIDLLLATKQAISRNYMVLEFYGALLLVYVVICLGVSRLGARLERRLAYIRY